MLAGWKRREQGCTMVEEAKCEDVLKFGNYLFAERCAGMLSWLGARLARNPVMENKDMFAPSFGSD